MIGKALFLGIVTTINASNWREFAVNPDTHGLAMYVDRLYEARRFLDSLLQEESGFYTFEALTNEAAELRGMFESPSEFCSALWQDFGEERRSLYRLDGILEELRRRFFSHTCAKLNYDLGLSSRTTWTSVKDVRNALHTAFALATAAPDLAGRVQAITAIVDDQATVNVFHEVFSRVRLLQSGTVDPHRVPLYRTSAGFVDNRYVVLELENVRAIPDTLKSLWENPTVAATKLSTVWVWLDQVIDAFSMAPKPVAGAELQSSPMVVFTGRPAAFSDVSSPMCSSPEETMSLLEAKVAELVDGDFCRDTLLRFVSNEDVLVGYGKTLTQLTILIERAYMQKMQSVLGSTANDVQISRMESFASQLIHLRRVEQFIELYPAHVEREVYLDRKYVSALREVEMNMQKSTSMYPRQCHELFNGPTSNEEFSHMRLVAELRNIVDTYGANLWKMMIPYEQSRELFAAFERALALIQAHPARMQL